ncbi:unnamed protein product [Cyclocybe aegerita]|uniref:Serine/threonine-protein phosphatase 2A activator n=1 Tax=Cyclocybe aegerita TaxID=1973307 RepID=A0A8S0VX11_CYCAE|nr:unnamed protein product [Cyclocybe aegerita]
MTLPSAASLNSHFSAKLEDAMENQLRELREVTIDDVARLHCLPSTKIRSESDLDYWKTTRSYADYLLFLRRLNESVVGFSLPWNPTRHTESGEKMMSLLDQLDAWIEDIPPLKTPQRFGNLAFRTWGQRLEEKAGGLLEQLLSPTYSSVIPHVKPYLLVSFGSFTRMDYGTGHETSFGLFLFCLTLVRFFKPVVEEERSLVLTVFLRYLKLCWKLQDTYKLEPAGSHGVWGLDDSCFLPYIFGSGQLRDQTEIPVSAVLQRPLPPTNLYFMSIMRILDVKYGPFHEHSSQLHSIATAVPNWGKVNSGLFKMYEAEVLGKRVVVQHIPLGGLLEWEHEHGLSTRSQTAPYPTSPGASQIYPSTAAPWATPKLSSFPAPTAPRQVQHLPDSGSQHPGPSSASPRPRRPL